MRGHVIPQGHMFSYFSPEDRVPAKHPLRSIKAYTDEALRRIARFWTVFIARSVARRSRRNGCSRRSLHSWKLPPVSITRLMQHQLTGAVSGHGATCIVSRKIAYRLACGSRGAPRPLRVGAGPHAHKIDRGGEL